MISASKDNPKTVNINPKKNSRYRRRLRFYILVLALPLLQFLIFYVYVNARSIGMAFFTYEANPDTLGYTTNFVWFDNFKEVFNLLIERPHLIVNSLRVFAFQIGLGMPLALIFSFYIYKKRFGHKYFKVILFLPQIISVTVFAIIFFSFSDSAITQMQKDWFNQPDALGVLSNPDTRLTALIIITVWLSFGVNVLLFTGSMNGINPSLVEAAELDGANALQEFWHVSLPCIFPTIISFIIVGFSSIFVEQMFLYTLNIHDDSISTIGFFLYVEAQSQTDINASTAGHLSYPALSAFSLLITAVLFPLTMGVRKLLTKYGPSTK